jgi:uncharacterized protein YigE (DUF2233 family)
MPSLPAGIVSVLFSVLLSLAGSVEGQPLPETVSSLAEHMGRRFVIVKINPREADLRLFWKRPNGTPFQTMRALEAWLTENDLHLVAAMNAGIFEGTQVVQPLGLHIEAGQILRPLNTASGQGNFYLKPNGVFYIQSESAGIVPTEDFKSIGQRVQMATQSGPLLVHAGQIHPRFQREATSRYTRSGVGIDSKGVLYWVHSIDEVSFFEFASFFRDNLKCSEALYLDGAISRIYAPPVAPMPRHESPLAGILAIVVKRESSSDR